MNTYHETDDGEALIIITEGTIQILIAKGAMRGMGKASDFQRGKVREQLRGVTSA
jgi:hypothetical protein